MLNVIHHELYFDLLKSSFEVFSGVCGLYLVNTQQQYRPRAERSMENVMRVKTVKLFQGEHWQEYDLSINSVSIK